MEVILSYRPRPDDLRQAVSLHWGLFRQRRPIGKTPTACQNITPRVSLHFNLSINLNINLNINLSINLYPTLNITHSTNRTRSLTLIAGQTRQVIIQ